MLPNLLVVLGKDASNQRMKDDDRLIEVPDENPVDTRLSSGSCVDITGADLRILSVSLVPTSTLHPGTSR